MTLSQKVIPLHPKAPEHEVDPNDLTAVVRAYRPYVAAVVMRMLGRDDEEVEDLVQDTFARALHGLKHLENPSRVKPFLATTAARLTLRKLRRRRLAQVFGLAERWHPTMISGPRVSPENKAILSGVYRVLETRSASEQAAWSLRYLEGEAVGRVAEMLGCSLSTAKRRIAAVEAALEEVHRD